MDTNATALEQAIKAKGVAKTLTSVLKVYAKMASVITFLGRTTVNAILVRC